jgi:Domain of unknown function (DUF5664)
MSAPPGFKGDVGKSRWDLLPVEAVREVVGVLTYGATKYTVDGWRIVPKARGRYYAATLRHLTSWWDGEPRDPETGLLHLAHAACNLLFLVSFEVRGYPPDPPEST